MNKAVTSLVSFPEIDLYKKNVEAFINEEIDADRFMAFRLQHGIYGQRQDGVHMVRVKLPGGRLNPDQLTAIAEALERHVEHPTVHITTRQDIQLHFVPLDQTPAVMKHVATVGLTTREACGNTVRNITACSLSGVCPHEHIDLAPLVQEATACFLRHPLTQHLPRKFKMSFSGCESDCAQGMMHDLGAIAVHNEGRFGFKVVAGGGLGHKPREAITIEEFIEGKELLACIEAVISLHNRYSDRKRRAKARIKFLVERFGKEGFISRYRDEFKRTKLAYADKRDPGGWAVGAEGAGRYTSAPRRVTVQKQSAYSAVPIAVPLGDITAAQLHGIATIMRDHGLIDLRVTQDQNIVLLNVPNEQTETILAALGVFGLKTPETGDDIVACPGTSTCRLGITSSMTIATKLNGGSADLRIRASGCHNGCAQPETGDIGIYGLGKRMHGKLIPHYQLYVGGEGQADGGLAIKGPPIPSARIEAAVERLKAVYEEGAATDERFFHWAHRQDESYFSELFSDLTAVSAEQIAEVGHDHGEADAFKVLQLGGGECAGAAQDIVASHFSEAAYERDCRTVFALQRKPDEAIECAEQIGRLVGQSLLYVTGIQQTGELADVVKALQGSLPDNARLGNGLAEQAKRLEQLKESFDDSLFSALAADQDRWLLEAADICQRMDSQLDLSASLPAQKQGTDKVEIDLSTYGCPLHYIKAHNELKKMVPGSSVDFLLESDKSARQLASSLESDGHKIIAMEEEADPPRITVQKGEAATATS